MNANARRWAATAAIAVSLLFVLSGLVSVLPIGGSAAAPNASAGAAHPLSKVTGADLTNPATAIAATIAQAPTDLQAALSRLPAAPVAAFWTALLAHDAKGVDAALAQISPAINPNCGTDGAWCYETTIAAVALMVCGVTAAPTLGLGCLVAGIAVLAIGLYEVLFGQNAVGSIGQQVKNEAENLVTDADTNFQLVGLGVVNQVNALNATVNALGYEAAAAALSQLGNASFNGPLDLAQSGVAQQLAAVLTAQMASIAQLTGQFEATAASQLGSGNSEGQTCSDGVASAFNPLSAPNIPFPTCPSNSPSTFYYTNGAVSFGLLYSTTSAVWLNHSAPITFDSGTGYWEFTPLDGSTPFYNVTLDSVPQVVNFSGPTDAYDIVLHGTSGGFYPTYSFPLLATEVPDSVSEYTVLNTSSGLLSWDDQNGPVVNGVTCGPNDYTCGTLSGATGTAQSSVNAPWYLAALAQSAETQAIVYWQVLRDLGYTAASQVPANCLIPSPAQLLPNDLTPTELASMNATAMLRIYYALLGNLAYTFNSTTALTAFNVCGKHVTVPIGGGPIGFGSYAYGYLYAPNASGWLVGSGSGGSAATLDDGAGGYGASTSVSVTAAIAHGQTAVIVAFSGGGTGDPLVASDSLGLTWAPYYHATGTGGNVGIFVVNSTTAAGSDTVALTTQYGGAATLLVFNGSGITPTSDLGTSGWVAGSGGKLLKATTTVPTSNEITVAAIVDTGGGNFTAPSARCAAGTGASADAKACVEALGAGSHSVSFGFGTASWGDLFAFSITGVGGSLGPIGGPQVYANPETWAYSGVLSFAPAIGPWAPTIGVPWLLPDDNPSFAIVEPFETNLTNASTDLGYVNPQGPTTCLLAHASAANCSLATSPLTILDYVGGNSSAGSGLTGSAFPTHEDGSGIRFSVYLTACFTAQVGATVENVTYTETTSGSCGFEHNSINSTAFVVCSDGAYVFNISSCPHEKNVLVLTQSSCGEGIPYLGSLIDEIASPISAVPILGVAGCAIAWVLVFVFVGILLVIVVWVVRAFYHAARGRGTSPKERTR
jgi:hypothetical protein